MCLLHTLQDSWQKPLLTRGLPSLAEISLAAITMVYIDDSYVNWFCLFPLHLSLKLGIFHS